MIHPSEDTLLKHALELHDEPAHQAEVETHLATCEVCRTQFDRIRGDINIISGIRPRSQSLLKPRPRIRPVLRTYFRIAAIVVLSFAAGFATSKLVDRKPASVIPSSLKPMPPALRHGGEAESDATQVHIQEVSMTVPQGR